MHCFTPHIVGLIIDIEVLEMLTEATSMKGHR